MITPAQAAQKLLERRANLAKLDTWARTNDFVPARHHSLINAHLEKVERGDIKKLMIFLPPGSAKSTYASVLFPPWFLSRAANRTILACSYSFTLVESFGRRCRNVVEQQSKTLGMELKPDSRAAGDWETTNGGRYFCAGVGAGIAGHRADLGLIDDPVGSREDADSEVYREKTWQWYLADFKPRLKPRASQVLIMTRWHEDDLAGRLLNPAFNEHEGWTILRLPFYADEEHDPLSRQTGERLWPEWFTDEMYSHDARTANALYQCRPTAESGNFFEKESILTYTRDQLQKIKDELSIYCVSDHALGKKEDNDFSCFVPFGVCPSGNIYILPDIFWSKVNSKEAVDEMFRMIERRRPIFWWAGKDHIEESIGPFLKLRMQEEEVFSCLVPISPGRKDKRARAQSSKGLMSAGRMFFPGFAHWWPQALAELLAFDAGTNDDFVDCVAIAGQQVLDMRKGNKRQAKRESLPPAAWVPTYRWVVESDERQRREALESLVEA